MEKAGAVIEMTLKRDDPLEAYDFRDLLTSIADQYDEFVRGTYPSADTDARFFINEVRKGSIVIEFAAATIGMMDSTIILRQFLELVQTNVTLFKTEPEQRTEPLPVAKRQQMVAMAKVVADSEDGKLALVYRERDADGSEAALVIGKDDARDILTNAATLPAMPERMKPIELPEGAPMRTLMRLYQHNQDPKAAEKKRSAHQAVVSEFSPKPKPITYETPEVAKAIADVLEDEPYASTIFDVTLTPRSLDGKVKAYNIVELHEWFPDDEPPDMLTVH